MCKKCNLNDVRVIDISYVPRKTIDEQAKAAHEAEIGCAVAARRAQNQEVSDDRAAATS